MFEGRGVECRNFLRHDPFGDKYGIHRVDTHTYPLFGNRSGDNCDIDRLLHHQELQAVLEADAYT